MASWSAGAVEGCPAGQDCWFGLRGKGCRRDCIAGPVSFQPVHMVINSWVAAIKTLSSRRENRIPDQESISSRTAAQVLFTV